MSDLLSQWAEIIKAAALRRKPIRIQGGNSKSWLGQATQADVFDTSAHRGIVSYEPNELVMTVRSGTPLTDIETALDAANQCLAFEPPRFANSTIGGVIATGLSGPRRVAAGSARDFVLGVNVIDGQGTYLKFGGQVMKNVAGFDASRLMVGAMGSLGVITEVSFKCLPKPKATASLQLAASLEEAQVLMASWTPKPLPITATAWYQGVLSVRLAGAEAAVVQAQQRIGGEALPNADAFWDSLRDQTHAVFQTSVLRVSCSATAAHLAVESQALIEWSGAQRWLPINAEQLTTVRELYGETAQVTCYRGHTEEPVFAPLASGLMQLQQGLKSKFDPYNILNPGRLYAGL
jgi:glycolate oxidase FAD binding subunit